MKWILGIAALALVALFFAIKKWASSADEFWDTIQDRADERDEETAAKKAADRAERQRKALERAEAAKAKAAAAEEAPAPAEVAAEAPPEAPAKETGDAPATFTDVGASGAVKLIAHRHDLTILDVRTPGETMAGVIEHALLIPMDQLQGRLGELPDGPLLVYCAVGARSAAVAEFLVGTGRDEVYNLDGGIMAWTGKVVRPA